MKHPFRVMAVGVVLVIAVVLVLSRAGRLNRETSTTDNGDGTTVPEGLFPSVTRPEFPHMPAGRILSARELTEANRAAISNVFDARLKPALEHWVTAYEGRVPFKPEDVNVTNLHSMLSSNSYTFMVDGATLVIHDYASNQNGVSQPRVAYFKAKGAMRELNSLSRGDQPDLSMPVTREDVLRMVEKDCGTRFAPEKAILKPTAQFTGMQGGVQASVDADLSNGGLSISHPGIWLVFGKDGKMKSYDR